MARRVNLDLRPLFRRFGRAEAARFADALAALAPKVRPDGRPVGGSLARELRKSTTVKVARWGYVVRLARVGQKLTWLTRGTVHQRARPFPDVPDRAQELAAAVADEVAAQFDAWDRSEVARA